MIVFLALVLHSQLPDSSRDVILSPKLAYVMLTPDVVCGPKVVHMSWTPDGKMLLVFRDNSSLTADMVNNLYVGGELPPTKTTQEVYLWNRRTKTGKLAFSSDRAKLRLELMSWMGNSGTVFLAMHASEDRTTREFYFVRSSGSTKLNLPPDGNYTAFVSPTHDAGALVSGIASGVTSSQSRSEPVIVRFFDSTGRFGPELSLPEANRGIYWRGNVPIVGSWEQVGDRRRLKGWFDVDKRTGALRPGSEPSFDENESPDFSIEGTSTDLDIGRGELVRVRPLTALPTVDLKVNPIRASLISGDGGTATIAPDNGAIAYTTHGVGLVRAMVPVPRADFERAETIIKARQVATALAMYSGDADDLFPPNSGWAEATNPYTKDISLLRNFIYTFSGGKLPEGTDPSKFVIGYMSGPGGRAMVYGDSSVKWEKDP